MTTTTTLESLQMDFEGALLKWIMKTSKPIYTVEHKSSKDIFSVTNRQLVVRSQRTVQQQVLKNADHLNAALKALSDRETHINVTSDAFSSSI